MPKQSHSPTPWTVQPCQYSHGKYTRICDASEDAMAVCEIRSRAWDPQAELEYPEDRANAKLIAAAPDLLDQLTTVTAALANWRVVALRKAAEGSALSELEVVIAHNAGLLCDDAAKVIAKATGEAE